MPDAVDFSRSATGSEFKQSKFLMPGTTEMERKHAKAVYHIVKRISIVLQKI